MQVRKAQSFPQDVRTSGGDAPANVGGGGAPTSFTVDNTWNFIEGAQYGQETVPEEKRGLPDEETAAYCSERCMLLSSSSPSSSRKHTRCAAVRA